ncbi:MAG TPA: Yip1 family protein [Chitinophagaceae bacterium]|jgi:hypothetical protein|nr:Yip1 family protein [Chitinophagaceae bacterium]
MNLIERVKNILTQPQKEWLVINGETPNPATITTTYIIPLAVIGAAACLLSWGVIGVGVGFGIKAKSFSFGLKVAIAYFIGSVAGPYITAAVIDNVGPNYGVDKNFGKAFQVAAYSATPGLVGGIFLLINSLAILTALAGLYGLYLLYIGLPILRPTKEADKKQTFFIVVLVVSIVVSFLIYFLTNNLFKPSLSDFS